jgi:hypothetical protein
MKCDCGAKTQTKDTRMIDLGIWRRRECPTCGTVITTLEQRCVTLANPYPNKGGQAGAQGKVIAPPMPDTLDRPKPPEKRARALRENPPAEAKPRRTRWADQPKPARPPSVDGKFSPAPADFAPPPEHRWALPDKHASVPVDRVTPTSRDKIEDMKAARADDKIYGWD